MTARDGEAAALARLADLGVEVEEGERAALREAAAALAAWRRTVDALAVGHEPLTPPMSPWRGSEER